MRNFTDPVLPIERRADDDNWETTEHILKTANVKECAWCQRITEMNSASKVCDECKHVLVGKLAKLPDLTGFEAGLFMRVVGWIRDEIRTEVQHESSKRIVQARELETSQASDRAQINILKQQVEQLQRSCDGLIVERKKSYNRKAIVRRKRGKPHARIHRTPSRRK